MVRQLSDYLGLVPGRNSQQPKFIATLTAALQPLLNLQALCYSLINTATYDITDSNNINVTDSFGNLVTWPAPIDTNSYAPPITKARDLDYAVGAQLDDVGIWVGRSRYIAGFIPNIYFTFNDPDLGFGAGLWKGPYDPLLGLTELNDNDYRIVLKAKIAANHWDGTVGTANSILQNLFATSASLYFIEDNQNMHMTMAVAGVLPTTIAWELFIGGYIPLKPAGVAIRYVRTSVEGAPIFGFNSQNAMIAGFGTGAWAADSLRNYGANYLTDSNNVKITDRLGYPLTSIF